MRMSQGPIGNRGITTSDWRSGHPSWNGGYYYHNGSYFYDSGFSTPAIVMNEWEGIAVLAGGVAFVGAIDVDPTLVFSGEYGDSLAINVYNADLNSSSGEDRLRAAYFSKPYFWRNGVRYDRVSINVGGVQSYRFQRH